MRRHYGPCSVGGPTPGRARRSGTSTSASSQSLVHSPRTSDLVLVGQFSIVTSQVNQESGTLGENFLPQEAIFPIWSSAYPEISASASSPSQCQIEASVSSSVTFRSLASDTSSRWSDPFLASSPALPHGVRLMGAPLGLSMH